MKYPHFKKEDGRTYRIVAEWVYEYEYGYAEPAQELDNILQVSSWVGWRTIERERVPNHAWISQMTLGDTGGWSSDLIAKHQKYLKNSNPSNT